MRAPQMRPRSSSPIATQFDAAAQPVLAARPDLERASEDAQLLIGAIGHPPSQTSSTPQRCHSARPGFAVHRRGI